MRDGQNSEISRAEKLLAPPEAYVTLIPLSAIKESDHTFFWAAFFMSIAACLFGCAASLYASSYEHVPFIVLVAGFGFLFLLFFAAFAARGLQIRKNARAREKQKSPLDLTYTHPLRGENPRTKVTRIHESISRAFEDGAERTKEEVIGILSGMSTDDVDVGTLHQVLHALVDAGIFTETEKSGRKLLTFNPEPVQV